ncbi:serine hydrolase [Pseudolysobacter antarcticus]|nr:serine hydrolase [Pseudolysobacter antarcticus]
MAEVPIDFDAHMEAAMHQYGVPGMAVSIVEDGKTVLAKGYGVRKLGSQELVDADTLFVLGSTTKAFTSAALAILVDEGKIGWDDKVTDHLPGFQMYDPWVTREITIRDLLVHRSGLGLGAGDLLFVPRTLRTRAEAVHALRYIKPATSFRSGYAYDNVLYMVAGQLIEAVSGQRWEDFVREHVLKPAGMNHSTTDEVDHFATSDRVQPHARLDGRIRGMGHLEMLDERQGLPQAAAPAGLLASSANDMARWLAIQLNHGALPQAGKDGARLFSEAASQEMWTPQVLTPISKYPAPLDALTPQFSAYALGWDVEDYRGITILEHGGAVLGEQSLVVLLPSRNVGFAMQANSEDGGVVMKGLMYELLDHYLGAPHHHWVADFGAFKKQRQAAAIVALDAMDLAQAKIKAGSGKPPLPLSGYVGKYADPWYGPIDVSQDKARLRIDFTKTPNMAATLEYWQYDTFRTVWDDKGIEPAYVTFALDASGKVSRINMKSVSPLADFSYDFQDLVITPQP